MSNLNDKKGLIWINDQMALGAHPKRFMDNETWSRKVKMIKEFLHSFELYLKKNWVVKIFF